MRILLDERSGIPLMGLGYIGIIQRNRNSLLQIRPTTLCNMSCIFCSTDGGPLTSRATQYDIEIMYLLRWIDEVLKDIPRPHIHIDSVGEPLMYPHLEQLVQSIASRHVDSLSLVTNGTLLTKRRIDNLEAAGLQTIVVSLHSLHEKKNHWLFGSEKYDTQHVLQQVLYAFQSRIQVLLSPVYIPGFNKDDIEELIIFAKEHGCSIAIQKYEIHRYGRKIKGVRMRYYHFYKQLRLWEKQFGIPLIYRTFPHVVPTVQKPLMRRGDRIRVLLKAPGWLPDQMIGVYHNRAVTVLHCPQHVQMKKVTVLSTRDNIYLAR